MYCVFIGASAFNRDLGQWDTSRVTNMYAMFHSASAFNQDIGKWNTSRVTIMNAMFKTASAFNQDIGEWDTGRVMDMKYMFRDATAFNQNIGKWDTGRVTSMDWMFDEASAFNQYIGEWDTSRVTGMYAIFHVASAFNQDIGQWDTSRVPNMHAMFHKTAFNQDIGKWDTSLVTTMTSMFSYASAFNQDLSSWDVAQVTEMTSIFTNSMGLAPACTKARTAALWGAQTSAASELSSWIDLWTDECTPIGDAFKPKGRTELKFAVDEFVAGKAPGSYGGHDIAEWDTGLIKDMSGMFCGLKASQAIQYWGNDQGCRELVRNFNGDIGAWDTTQVTTMLSMFLHAKAFNQNVGKWDTSRVVVMAAVFRETKAFNQKLEAWNTSSVMNMHNMFERAVSFDQDIRNWDTSRVTQMATMFEHASVFNQNIEKWDTSRVVYMKRMFLGAQAFRQDLSAWNVTQVENMEQIFSSSSMQSAPACIKARTAASLVAQTSAASEMSSWIDLWTPECAPIGDAFKPKDRTELKFAVDEFVTGKAPGSYGGHDIAEWNTGLVEDMSGMFCGAKKASDATWWGQDYGCKDSVEIRNFNADVGKWDTSRVTTMYAMFLTASVFNQDIGQWNTGRVTEMPCMFDQASAFNQNIGRWDTSRVINMLDMFKNAVVFNQDIGQWDTSRVTVMQSMFYYAVVFNQDIGQWDTSRCTNMVYMFNHAFAFNHDIGKWDTSRVTEMRRMFMKASAFNQDIGSWKTGLVTDMQEMFHGASIFNTYIGDWDARRVKTMQDIFKVTELLYNHCLKHRIANNWGRDSDRGGSDAFKIAYPNWTTWIDDDEFSLSCGCLAGRVCVGDATQPCDEGHWCPFNTTSRAKMKSCPNGKYGRPLPLGKKAVGHATQESACGMCLPGRYGSGVGKVGVENGCTRCPKGRASTYGAPGCYLICSDLGHYWDGGGNCTACPAGKALPILGATNSSSCVPCDAGSVASNRGSANCRQCGAGTRSSGDRAACVACIAGTASLGGTANCTPCAPGSFASNNASGFCLKCTLGRFSSAQGMPSCSHCASGTFQDSVGATGCKSCEEGSVSDQGAAHCQKCAPGRHHRINLRPPECVLCVQGTVSGVGTVECTSCTTGRFASLNHTRCEPCPVGTWSDALGAASDAFCRPCPRGFYSSATGLDAIEKCTACPPGKYSSTLGANSSGVCLPCEVGYFAQKSGQIVCEACTSGSSDEGSSYCSDCPAGKEFNPETRLCDPCSSGQTSDAGGKCWSCPAGTFEHENVDCEPCPIGTWNDALGGASDALCRPCPGGTFSSALGLDSEEKCNMCPPGKSSRVMGANTSALCLPCHEGYFAENSGQTACKACTSGSSSRGSSYCRDCPAGKEYNITTKKCDDCARGSYSGVGKRCRACFPGTYEQGRVKCMPCPAGTWNDAMGATNDALCRPCPSGTFSNALGVDNITKCESCERGRFAESPGSDACQQCADRMKSNEDHTGCVVNSCTPGTMLEKSTEGFFCKSCSEGTFSATGGECKVCEEGRFTKTSGSDACERCPDFMTSRSDNAAVCIAAKGYIVGHVWGKADMTLHPCPKVGALCKNAIGAQVERLALAPGYWRPTHSSLDVYPCKAGSGCVGGTSTGSEGQGVCDNATTGPYCAVCAKEYKRQGGVCVSCDELDGNAATPLLIMLGVGLLIALLALVAYKYKPSMFESAHGVALVGMADHSGDNGGHGRVVEKFKIAYGFAQVVSSTFEEFDLKFPPVFSALASAFSVVNLDIFGFLSVGCVVDVDFYGELTTTCTAPAVLAVLSLGYARHRSKSKKEKRTARQIFTRFFLVLLFCVYSGVTRKIFTTFKCEHFVTAGLGEAACDSQGYAWRGNACYRSYMRADLSLSCDASEYASWKAFAVLMALMYPFGVPLLFAWLLHRDKDDASLSFIRAAYEDQFYWWEVVELGRKLLLTLVVVFFYEGSASQILVTLLVAFGFTLLLRTYKPYQSDDDDFLAAFAQALLVLTSLASLCLKVDIAENDSWSEGAFDFFLTALVVSVPVLALFEALVASGLLRRMRCRRGKPKLLTNAPPSSDTTVDALLALIRDIPDEELKERLERAIDAHSSGHGDTKSAPSNPSVISARKTLNTKFHDHYTCAASHDDPERRASALAKAHVIYDDAEAARRARIASQRREQHAKIKKRLESRKMQRAAAEQQAREASAPPPDNTETRPPALTKKSIPP